MNSASELAGDQGRWQLTDSCIDDRDAILQLFEEVFGHTLTPEMWHWKYGEGRGHACLVWKQQQLVAHYGGLNRQILMFGKPAEAVQIGDVMVQTQERGTLSRKGPFMLAASDFLERYIGYGRRYILGYGFPTRRAMLAASRQGLYRQVDSIVEHRWPLQPGRQALFSCVQRLTEQASEKTVTRINAVWQAMQEAFSDSIIGVRDWAFLVQRYMRHPQRSYDLYLVKKRFGGTPLGVIVLATEGERCRLMDVIGNPAEFPRLISHAQKVAVKGGANELYGWVTQSHSHLWTGETVPQDLYVPTNIWSDGPAVEEIEGRWWLTSGDADFC